MEGRPTACGKPAGRPVLVIGPLPPPIMGPAVGTQVICKAFERAGVAVIHVNTQDRRPASNMGVLDLQNALLALLHAAQTAWRASRHAVRFVYVPISQSRWGYARDALLISIARALGKPVVVHLRGATLQEFFDSSSWVERLVIRKTLAWATLAIALTPNLRSVYSGLVPEERVKVLENAIPDPWPGGLETLQEERRARRSRECVNILYMANDFETKGATRLLKALAHPGFESVRVRMVGAPPAHVADATASIAAKLGLADRVEMPGSAVGHEKERQLAWADVFAYPTENDAQPLVILEAMAAGLPIVTTRLGGIPDTVGQSALLVDPGDEPALTRALRALVCDPCLRERLGNAARERFADNYTIEHFQMRFRATFADLIGAD